MGIPSGFLMGVSAICVRQRRKFRVRNDLVQCDVDTVQYSLFNFGVNKFISGVKSYNLGVNIYSHGVNQVTRVDKTIWCDSLSMVYIILFWYEHTNTV
jgi:hypothetical protein